MAPIPIPTIASNWDKSGVVDEYGQEARFEAVSKTDEPGLATQMATSITLFKEGGLPDFFIDPDRYTFNLFFSEHLKRISELRQLFMLALDFDITYRASRIHDLEIDPNCFNLQLSDIVAEGLVMDKRFDRKKSAGGLISGGIMRFKAVPDSGIKMVVNAVVYEDGTTYQTFNKPFGSIFDHCKPIFDIMFARNDGYPDIPQQTSLPDNMEAMLQAVGVATIFSTGELLSKSNGKLI